MEAGSIRHNGQSFNGRTPIKNLEERITKNRAGEIALAVAMVVLGLLILFAPVTAGVAIAYAITIAFIAIGIYCIVKYIRTPADYKDGWTLANGILFALFGILVLAESFGGTSGQLSMISTIAFVIGFMALFQGINTIATNRAYKESGGKKAGLRLATGIIDVLLGVAIVLAPVAGYFAMQWVFGIYLIVEGIFFFANGAGRHQGSAAFQAK